MANKLTPEQEDFKPEPGADMQNGIDLYAIARKALNTGLNRARIPLDPTAKDKITIKIVAELGERELRTEGDYEKRANGIVQRYFDEAESEIEPEPNKEQPSPGNLEKSLTGKKVALADALPSGLDLHGIIRKAIDNKLNEEQGQFIEIKPKNKALLVSDLVKFLESHNITTAEEAVKIAREEVKYCLEPYRNTNKIVEQPENEPGMPEPRTAGWYANEFIKEKKGLGRIILAASAAVCLGVIGMCGYYTFFKDKPKPVVTNPAPARDRDDLEDVLKRKLSINDKTIQDLKDRLAAAIKEKPVSTTPAPISNPVNEPEPGILQPAKNYEEEIKNMNDILRKKQDFEQRRKSFYELLEMKRTGKITTFDENQFKDIKEAEEAYGLLSILTEFDRARQRLGQKDEELAYLRKALESERKPGQSSAGKTADDLLAEIEKENPAQRLVPATPNPYSFSITPYAGMKFALNAEDKPDPMPVYGLELEVGKENGSVYLGAEYGEIDDSETTSAGSLDLKSKATTFRLGGKLSTGKERKLIGSIGAGARVTLEKNEITGRVGTYDVNDSRDETIFGAEATAGLEFRLTDNISLTAGATYGHNFKDDNSNVTDDLTGRIGVVVKF